LSKHKHRAEELNSLIKKLYESFATGKLPEKHFEKLLVDYDNEQTALERIISELQAEINTWGADIEKTDKFIELVKRYTDIEELSNQMVNEFIEKIIVHEADKTTGKREQKVDVYLNFIGNFITPPIDVPLTQKEIAQQEEAERLNREKLVQQKTKSREKSRRWREKIKGSSYHEDYKAKRRALYAEKTALLKSEKAVIAVPVISSETEIGTKPKTA
jgi:hypothetical protein